MKPTNFKKLEEHARNGVPLEFDAQNVEARVPMALDESELMESEPSEFDQVEVAPAPVSKFQAKDKYAELLRFYDKMKGSVADRNKQRDGEYAAALDNYKNLTDKSNLLRGAQEMATAGTNRNPFYSVADNMSKEAETALSENYKRNADRRSEEDQVLNQEKDLMSLDKQNIDNSLIKTNADVNSNTSSFLQDLVTRDNPELNKETIANMSHQELVQYLDYMREIKNAKLRAQAARGSDKGRFQKFTYTDPVDGKIKMGSYDTATQTYKKGADDMLAGYSPAVKTNPLTGDTEIISKGTMSAAPVVRPGQTAGTAEAPSDFEKLNPNERKDLAAETKVFEARTKDENAAVNNLSTASGLIKDMRNGNRAALGPLKATVTRMFEKGVLTDEDINRYSGDTSLSGKLRDMVSTNFNGTLSDQTLNQLEQVLNTLSTSKKQIIQEEAKELAKRFGNRHQGSLKTKNVNTDNLTNTMAPVEKTVTIQAPNGEKRKVKESAVEKYLKMGGTVVPE